MTKNNDADNHDEYYDELFDSGYTSDESYELSEEDLEYWANKIKENKDGKI